MKIIVPENIEKIIVQHSSRYRRSFSIDIVFKEEETQEESPTEEEEEPEKCCDKCGKKQSSVPYFHCINMRTLCPDCYMVYDPLNGIFHDKEKKVPTCVRCGSTKDIYMDGLCVDCVKKSMS